jgi:RNA polymerase sigma factor (sigma-70 family)
MRTARPDGRTLVDQATDAFTRYRAGERGALDELVAAVTPLLWRTVRETGLDAQSSEDVVQTVWLTLLRSTDSVRDPHAVVKWLLTATRREAWRVSRRVHDDTVRHGGTLDDGSEEPRHLPARRDPLPEDVVFRDERQRCLWDHVQGLSPRCRQLMCVIAFADRPDYALIAESLGMPVGSIGPTRGRCLAKLRGLLDEDPRWEGMLS